jgi:hypothetical protein
MVFAAPELVETEPVQVFHQVKVTLELQRRVLSHRMVRRQERAEANATDIP